MHGLEYTVALGITAALVFALYAVHSFLKDWWREY